MLALLSPVEARTEVAVAPDGVWATISDPTTYPDWLVGAQRIRGVEPEFPQPGADFHHSVGPTGALTIDDATTSTDASPPHRLVLLVRAGPFRAEVEMRVLPTAKGSEIRFRERPTGSSALLTPLLRPILHTRNAESLRRLCRYLEERDG